MRRETTAAGPAVMATLVAVVFIVLVGAFLMWMTRQ
jgi:hypothetical protein